MNYTDVQSAIVDEIKKSLSNIDSNSIDKLVNDILSAKRIFVTGAGRSGLMIKAFAMRLMHMNIPTYVLGEIATPSVAKGDLLIIASGSGSTGSLVNVAQKAKSYGLNVALITTKEDSPIGLLSDTVVCIKASSKQEHNDITIQPMGSLYEQSLMLLDDVIVLLLMNKLNLTSDEMFKNHANLE